MLIGFDASRAFVCEATGTENYSLNLLRTLAKLDRKNGYRVYLRESQSGKSKWKVKNNNSLYTTDFDFELPNNFKLKIIRPYRFWTQIGLALETWRNPVDLLFIPAHTLPILRRWSAADGRPIKTVVTIHDLGVEFLPGYHQFPQRYYLDFASKYACRHADAIIAVSAATKADIVKRYQIEARRVFVVHEGVDTTFFKPSSKLKVKSVKSKYKINRYYILFVGTVQPRKNLEMLIKVFGRLIGSSELVVYRKKKTMNCDLRTINLVIAGKLGWDYQEILNAPKKYGVEKQVKFLGYVPREDLPALYSGACVFAFPSLFEGFGLPILEALSCGCPVLASNIAPHRDIFSKISSNFKFRASSKFIEPMILVKPNDTEKWVDVLHQYTSQYNKRSLKIKARYLASKFTWDTAANKTLKILEGVLG